MSSVLYIHTQAPAQAEIDRTKSMERARRAVRKQRMQEDPEYAQEVQTREIEKSQKCRAKKRKIIEDNSLHPDAQKEANRKSEARKVVQATKNAEYAQEREDMLERVRQRYYLYGLSQLMLFRIDELDAQFADLRVREQEWPTPLRHAKPMTKSLLYIPTTSLGISFVPPTDVSLTTSRSLKLFLRPTIPYVNWVFL
jgi:hypothetical protein